MRLFDEQGYDATTIEQIAAAAGVSPSTFYRYFPTKEDVVVQDEYDPMIIGVFQSQPEGVAPIDALRATLTELFGQFTAEDMQRIHHRVELIYSVPALQARQIRQTVATERMICDLVAARAGRDPADLEVRNFAATLVAAWVTAITAWSEKGGQGNLLDYMDRCLTHLEAGVPL